MGKVKQTTGIDIAAPVKAVQSGISSIGNATGLSKPLTQVFQPLEKAVVQPVGRGLASFDKAVGNTIPGGWGTVGATALSMIPGAQPFAVGLGALNGSGVMRKGGNFNLQGAIMGGAMAYGMSELGEYARAAGGAADAVEKVAEQGLSPISATAAERTAEEIAKNSATQMNSALASESANILRSVPQPTSFTSNVLSGNLGEAAGQLGTKFTEGASQLGTNIMNAPSDIYQAGINAKDAVANYDYSGALKNAGQGMSDTLSGAGKILTGNANPAAAAAVKAGTTMSPLLATGMTVYTGMGLQALDDQRKYLQDQANSGAISNAQYQEELARIEAQAEQGRKVVAANPLRVNPGMEGLSEGETLYGRKRSDETLYDKNPYGGTTLYAVGGAVNTNDDLTNMPNQSPMQRFENNGLMSMVSNTVPQQTFATGGMPRFLSGGGDGMSDSIKASINDSQEARLADGEFVVPADVVSHIGNGSSKAGAKQLYSMMDRVRQARTGRKSQGKQINPRKYLAA